MMRPLTLLCAVTLFAACASSTGSDPTGKMAPAVATSSVPDEGLPPQRLKPGECGLFLWGMSAPRKFVFFTNGTGTASVLVDDTPVSLPLSSANGNVFGQFMTSMTFRDAATGGSVTVEIEPGEPLEGGQRVESGTLQFRDTEGWETILPITGVRACLPG
jgi:hypothetical protein